MDNQADDDKPVLHGTIGCLKALIILGGLSVAGVVFFHLVGLFMYILPGIVAGIIGLGVLWLIGSWLVAIVKEIFGIKKKP